jgi:hypothetical protein
MDADMDHDEEAEGERLKDIEQAIEELTAEFEAMKAELHGEHGDAEGDKMPLQEMADSGTTPGGKQYKISGDFETVTVNGTSYPIRKLSGQGDNPDYVIDDIHIGQTYQDMPHPDADEEDYEEEYEVWTEAPGQADNTLHVGTWDECWNFLIDQLGSEDHSRLKRRLQRDASGGGMREGWMDNTDDLDEDYDDLDEAIALDTVHVDLKKVGEVGSGKFSRSDVSKHSPVPKGVQSPVPGAKPVVTGKGSKADGYHLQSAPTSASMNLSNRRKKASEDMTHVSKEGSTKAMLNKDRSEGFGAANVRSPLGSTGTTPKK